MDSNAIRVQIDPEIRDLIPVFLDHRHQDVVQIQDCLCKNDFGTIENLGHSMKGAGAGYGFDAISDIGALIERAAKGRDSTGILNAASALAIYLSRVVVSYE